MSEPDREGREVRIWRNYREGKVGFQIEGLPDVLLSPAEARMKADDLEEGVRAENPEYLPAVEGVIGDLREYADEIEGIEEE